MELLDDEWEMEYLFSRCRLDAANSRLMVDIEVDGPGHSTKGSKISDGRRDAFLQRSGWAVIRITNEEVDRGEFFKIEQYRRVNRRDAKVVGTEITGKTS